MIDPTQQAIDAAAERFQRAYGAAQEALARLVEKELRAGKTAAEVARALAVVDFEAFLERLGYQAEAVRVNQALLSVLKALKTRGTLGEQTLAGLIRTFGDSFLANANAYPAQLKAAAIRALLGGAVPSGKDGVPGRGAGAAAIRKALEEALPARQARTLADTALQTFSRAVEREMAEQDPADARYVYIGPVDDRTRPACIEMAAAGPLTLAEIDERFPGAFVDGGGFNCRHKWVAAGSAPNRNRVAREAAQERAA